MPSGGTTVGAGTGDAPEILRLASFPDWPVIGESSLDGTFTREYLYHCQSRLAMVDVGSDELYTYGNDSLGTPEILLNSTNAAVWEAKYKPFGEVQVNPNSTVENNFRFPGQYYDEETGLHYNYYRYYDPKTGRYLTPDPLGLYGGDFSPFLYSSNNPINSIDPYGLFDLKSLLGSKPGGLFSLGFSVYTPKIIGLSVSFDRIIMQKGEVDWFLTVGLGIGVPGGAIAIDRGIIEKTKGGSITECDTELYRFY